MKSSHQIDCSKSFASQLTLIGSILHTVMVSTITYPAHVASLNLNACDANQKLGKGQEGCGIDFGGRSILNTCDIIYFIRNASTILGLNLSKDMVNLRKYGNKPYSIAVIHGGPGTPGEMTPVARELSSIKGVLELLQTAATIEGQVEELKIILLQNGALPITLIGFSWGAMLSFIFAAKNPSFVNRFILISSGVYEEEYAVNITGTRLIRLSDEERKEVLSLSDTLNDTSIEDKSIYMAKLGRSIFKADSYDPLTYNSEVIEYQY